MTISTLKTTMLTLLLGVSWCVLSGCTTNAATGRSQLNFLSTEEEIALGTQAMPELVQSYGGEVQSADLRNYVTEVGQRLALQTEADYPNLPWEFTLLDSDVINAFALPGGKVFISRALFDQLENEAQLAGVLGHEIGHVVAEHIDERISRQTLINGGLQAAGAMTESGQLIQQVGGLFANGYLLKFGRDQESESDILGVKYMTKAGYNPRGMLGVLEVLARASEGQGRQPEFLSTHPYPETRIQTVTALLQDEYRFTQGNPDYRDYADRFRQRAGDRTTRGGWNSGRMASSADMPQVSMSMFGCCAH